MLSRVSASSSDAVRAPMRRRLKREVSDALKEAFELMQCAPRGEGD